MSALVRNGLLLGVYLYTNGQTVTRPLVPRSLPNTASPRSKSQVTFKNLYNYSAQFTNFFGLCPVFTSSTTPSPPTSTRDRFT